MSHEYYEAWVIVEGALDENQNHYTWDAFRRWADKAAAECREAPGVTDWSIQWRHHPHPMNRECECHQYESPETYDYEEGAR